MFVQVPALQEVCDKHRFRPLDGKFVFAIDESTKKYLALFTGVYRIVFPQAIVKECIFEFDEPLKQTFQFPVQGILGDHTFTHYTLAETAIDITHAVLKDDDASLLKVRCYMSDSAQDILFSMALVNFNISSFWKKFAEHYVHFNEINDAGLETTCNAHNPYFQPIPRFYPSGEADKLIKDVKTVSNCLISFHKFMAEEIKGNLVITE